MTLAPRGRDHRVTGETPLAGWQAVELMRLSNFVIPPDGDPEA